MSKWYWTIPKMQHYRRERFHVLSLQNQGHQITGNQTKTICKVDLNYIAFYLYELHAHHLLSCYHTVNHSSTRTVLKQHFTFSLSLILLHLCHHEYNDNICASSHKSRSAPEVFQPQTSMLQTDPNSINWMGICHHCSAWFKQATFNLKQTTVPKPTLGYKH